MPGTDEETRATAFPFRRPIRVRFAETDAMGVVHHASYLAYLEEARVAFLRARGRPYPDIRAAGLDIAVVEVQVRYRAPLRFDDVVEVHVRLEEVTGSSFRLAYLLLAGADIVATASTRHACLDARTGRPQRTPPWLAGLADIAGPPGDTVAP